MRKIFRDFTPYLPQNKDAAILDIGCGKGDFLKFLNDNRFNNIFGIDINNDVLKLCNKEIIDRVQLIDDLESFLKTRSSKYDLITLKEVIYYFPREKIKMYMEAIKEALKDNGRIVVEVFNGSAWTGPFIAYNDYKINCIFTEYSLASLLRDSGYKIEKIFGNSSTVNSPAGLIRLVCKMLLDIFLRIIYFVERGRGIENPRIFSKYLIAIARKRTKDEYSVC